MRQEVVVNGGGGGHSSHSKDQDHSSLQGGQDTVSRGQQADALATVMFGAVKRVEGGHMSPQTVADGGQGPAECSCQKQAQDAVWRPLMEEVQSYREAAGQRELALEEEQVNSSAAAILGGKNTSTRCCLEMMYSRVWKVSLVSDQNVS